MASITSKLALTGALAMAVSGGVSGSALAAEGEGLTCTTVGDRELACVGSVLGAKVAGRGTYELRGDQSDDTCLVGNGRGGLTAALPVVTVLGERTLTIDADYSYVRTGAARIATGYADATITEFIAPFGSNQRGDTDQSARLAFSSVGGTTGELGLNGCPLLGPGRWAEHIGLGAAAPRVEANGPAAALGLRRGACANPQTGTARSDRLTGTVAGDRLLGAGGADTLSGMPGHDCLTGGRGADALNGGGGHDALSGGAGRDVLRSGAGNDALVGAGGADVFSGGAGRDVIDARDGLAESISCGAGRDSVRADSNDRLSGCETRRVAG